MSRSVPLQVTKMRCWRIMTVGGGRDNDLIIGGGDDGGALTGDDHDVCPQQKLELSFEYLMNTGELQWVTVVSTQAILMSLCLQSMVEELLRIRSGAKIKTVRLDTEIESGAGCEWITRKITFNLHISLFRQAVTI